MPPQRNEHRPDSESELKPMPKHVTHSFKGLVIVAGRIALFVGREFVNG
jgi:hypothetical protein